MGECCVADAAEERAAEIIWVVASEGATRKDDVGISHGMMDGLYVDDYEVYKQGGLDEDEKFFRFL
ncbi:hypothetical protein [Salmonella enterica]|uniref:hypothetical protein n=1 Tax=Salmonella enterica TaxID=28901 RepID=UPI00398C2538